MIVGGICQTCGSSDIRTTQSGGKKYVKCRPCWASYMKKWNNNNKSVVSAKNKRYKQKYPNKCKDSVLRTLFGISLQQYEEIHTRQSGKCAVCGKEETALHNSTGKVRRLAVDHCHRTGKVRGLLCSKCNTAMGLLQEDVEVMQRLIEYTERTCSNGS